MTEIIHSYKGILWGLTITSGGLFLLSLIVIPFLLVRIPSDYFIKGRVNPWTSPGKLSPLKLLFLIIKNLIGVTLFICGIAMLILPGQGILTILISTMLIDFPGKKRFECWLVSRPYALNTINRLRRYAKHKPLKINKIAEK